MQSTALITIFTVSLPIGLAAGFIMHRSDFCLTAIFQDFFLFGERQKLRIFALMTVSTMCLVEVARRLGLIALYPFPILASPSFTNLLGGFLFGIGMVLAGGCVVGTLYKMGAGSVLSAVAFIGLIVGSILYAEIHPWWAVVTRKMGRLHSEITLPKAMAIDPGWFVGMTVVISAFYFGIWGKKALWKRSAYAEGYIQPWKAALALSGLGVVSYVLIGMPLGITTAYAKIGAYLLQVAAPLSTQKMPFFQAVSLKYTDPLTKTYLEGGAGPSFDAIAAVQFPIIIGIVAGSFLSASLLKEFRPRWNLPRRQYVTALFGGIVLALASRMTPGCNVWHLLGGLPIFALQSLLFLIGLLPGTWVGSKLVKRIYHGT